MYKKEMSDESGLLMKLRQREAEKGGVLIDGGAYSGGARKGVSIELPQKAKQYQRELSAYLDRNPGKSRKDFTALWRVDHPLPTDAEKRAKAREYRKNHPSGRKPKKSVKDMSTEEIKRQAALEELRLARKMKKMQIGKK